MDINKVIGMVLTANPQYELVKLEDSLQREIDLIEKGVFFTYDWKENKYWLHACGSYEQTGLLEKTKQTKFETLDFDIVKWLHQNSLAVNDGDTIFEQMYLERQRLEEEDEAERKLRNENLVELMKKHTKVVGI